MMLFVKRLRSFDLKLKKVALIVNSEKQRGLNYSKKLIKWLQEHNIEALIPESEKEHFPELNSNIAEADLVVTIGGDGTVLRAVRLFSKKAIPFLTINFGRVGFLTEVKPENFEEAFINLKMDEFFLEKKRLLKCKVLDSKKEYYSLNDVTVTRRGGNRTLNLDVYISGFFLYSYSCDGIVVSSNTGSTAYSLSLGGPVLTPNVTAKVVVPMNPHTLFDKSIVVAEHEPVKIIPRDSRDVVVQIDGIVADGGVVKSAEITIANSYANIIRFDKGDFIENLKERLFKL